MAKVIVITGGSDGLGKALAIDLAKENKVIILATNEEKLKQAAREAGCDYYVCDVRKYNIVEKVMDSILQKYKQIDILINNAGLLVQGELDQNDSMLWSSIFVTL